MVREYSFEQRFSTLFWVPYLERVEDREVHGTLLLNKLRRYTEQTSKTRILELKYLRPPVTTTTILQRLCINRNFSSINTRYGTVKLVERNPDRNSSGQNMAIMTDSQAAIRALGSPKIYSIKMVWEHQSKLNDLGRKQKLPSCG